MRTGYARLTPWQAYATFAIAALGTFFCVAVAVSPLWQGKADQKGRVSDIALYQAEEDRIHNGQGYYQAAAAELTARGYPTRSVFNWRTPLPIWLIGRLPQVVWGKYLLGFFALGLIVLAFEALSREKESSFNIALGCVALLSGPLMFTLLDNLFVMPVLWAGVLLAFSLCAYGVGRPKLGVALGLMALFLRELAFPYCLLCVFMAWVKYKDTKENNSRQELICWGLGLFAWLIFFGWHWWQVSGMVRPDALAHPHGWLRFGGAGFVLATAQMNAYLLLLPPWVTALYFSAAMFGLAGWNTELGRRIGLTTCMYVVAFAFIGQDFNQYWGSLIAPLLCFGAVRMPASMMDLLKSMNELWYKSVRV